MVRYLHVILGPLTVVIGLRTENIRLKQQSALIGADDLLRDFDSRESRIEEAEKELAALTTKFKTVKARIRDTEQLADQLQATAPQRAGTRDSAGRARTGHAGMMRV